MTFFQKLFCCFKAEESPQTPREEQQIDDQINNSPSTTSCSTPAGPYKFVFDRDEADRVTGINNSGSKYAVDKPVQERTTPYEERIERAMQEEELAMARRREKIGGGDGGS